MSYELHQGIIQGYTSATACNVLQIPDNYLFTDVRLPGTLQNQTKPLEGSVVLLATEDGYKAYIICVLRDPIDFLNKEGGLRAGGVTTRNLLQPGELFFESRGDPTSPLPGTGATLYLSNAGTINLHSGQRQEFVTIGGRVDDEDHEIVLQADNGILQSNISPITNIRSTINFDDLNNIQIGNNFVVSTSPVIVEQPVGELKIDTLGNILLRSATLGVTQGKLSIDSLGDVVLSTVSPAGTLSISTLGGNISIASTAGKVKLNGGLLPTQGVARLNDLTTSNVTIDPVFWTFWSTLSGLIAALPVTAGDGGATFKTGLAALFATMPTAQTAKITSASTTVSAGS